MAKAHQNEFGQVRTIALAPSQGATAEPIKGGLGDACAGDKLGVGH
jgi:hypothetical protein